MREPEPVENLIVGSGLASIATAMALRRRQSSFEVVDFGNDLDAATETDISALARFEPAGWDDAVRRRILRPLVTSANKVERRLAFGSDFPYRIPSALVASFENCKTELSHATGGLGNVWGAAMLPYTDLSLRGWPISAAELEKSYRNVLSYVPLSAEKDDLHETFPLYTESATPLARSPQVDGLLRALGQRGELLRRNGIAFGRARTAVNSTAADAGTCRYCGHCLEGCVYGSIFPPRGLWKRVISDQRLMHRGHYVLEFKEHGDRVLVTTVSAQDGSRREWSTRRLFLAAGHLATTRIVARSLGQLNRPIRILDSQYFYFPLLSYRSFREDMRFALAEVFIEILNKAIVPEHLHFQVYSMTSLFKETLRRMIPEPFSVSPITKRLLMFQGFLPSDVSGHLEMTLLAAKADGDEIYLKGVENPQAMPIAAKSKALLAKSLRTFGVAVPFYLKMVPPGRSFHSGGAFPMGGGHDIYSSDALGRPAGLKRVHIVDSANFPSIASSTIGFTIMANADRIAEASVGQS